jgi:hypothetical protein
MVREAKAPILEMVQRADLGILDLHLDRAPEDQADRLRTVHQRYDEAHQPVEQVLFDLVQESEGTQKFLALSGPILDVLATNKVQVIDEFDARLHPLLTRAIVQMFHAGGNRSQAQLIITTHDSNLLDRRIFRKDQIWFTEKDPYGATALYSLAEFRVKEDANYERDYIHGRYGAVPLIGDLWQMGEE